MPFPDAKYPPKCTPHLKRWQTALSPGDWVSDLGEIYDGDNQIVCYMQTTGERFNLADATLIANAKVLLEGCIRAARELGGIASKMPATHEHLRQELILMSARLADLALRAQVKP